MRHPSAWRIFAWSCVAVSLVGQSPSFAYLETSHFDIAPSGEALGVGDIDGDGDLDALFGNVVYRNDGKAFFTRDATLPLSMAGCVVDLDGDHCCEIVQIERVPYTSVGQAVVYRRLATGGYTQQAVSLAQPLPLLVAASTLACADLDGDGDPEVLASVNGGFVYLRNDAGLLVEVPALAPPGIFLGEVLTMNLADVDLDGRVDLVRHAQFLVFPSISWCKGTGSGGFLPPVAIHEPVDEHANPARMQVADFDGDGDPDLAYTRNDLAAPPYPRVQILRNDRPGWTSMPMILGGLTEAVAVGVSRRRQSTPQLLVQFRDYNGTSMLSFMSLEPNGLRSTWVEAYEQVGAPIAEVDLDGDLDPDWLGTGVLRLGRWNGADEMVDAQIVNPRLGGSNLVRAWVQSDGLVIAPGFGFLSNTGILNRLPPLPNGLPTTDLAFYPQFGLGRFVAVAANQLWTSWWGTSGWVDLQGLLHDVGAVAVDRQAHIFATCSDFPGGLALLDGNLQVDVSASAAIPAPRLLGTSSHRLLVADLEGDGHDDVIHSFRWLRSSPTATLQDVGDIVPSLPVGVRDLATVDFDGDGDLDLYLARAGLDVLLELRNGAFVDATIGRIPTENSDCGGVQSGDLDGDGDQDLLLLGVTISGQTIAPVWLRNDGGRFVRQPFPLGSPILLADVDQDGDADVLTATRWLRNTARQFHVPRLPLLGGTFVVDLHRNDGFAGTPWALVAMGSPATPAAVPGIEGLLALDRSALTVLGVAPLSQGITSLSTRLPSSALLFGMPLATQALWLEPAGRAWLSSPERQTIW